MSNKQVCVALLLGICLVSLQAFAQETRSDQIEQEIAAKAANLTPEEREKGDRMITRLERLFMPQPPAWRLTLGDFRPGAGLAAGVAYARPALSSGLWTTKAAWSINNFKQAQSTIELPLTARFGISPAVQWDDAPDLRFFGISNASSRANEVSYGLRSLEAGVQADGSAARWLRYGASVGYLRTHSYHGNGSEPSIGAVFTGAMAPGLGTGPAWVHATAYAAFDTRESPTYTQRGAFYGVRLHRYADSGSSRYSFDRTEIDLRQFIPLLHNNWIIALQGRADITRSASGHVIPYFMLPSIGGRDTLPGYDSYRFIDNNSLLLRSELRWPAAPLLDMAVFLDHGKVAPRVAGLNLQNLHRDVGFGARFHSSTFTALRLEVAHSVEGWHLNFAHTISF